MKMRTKQLWAMMAAMALAGVGFAPTAAAAASATTTAATTKTSSTGTTTGTSSTTSTTTTTTTASGTTPSTGTSADTTAPTLSSGQLLVANNRTAHGHDGESDVQLDLVNGRNHTDNNCAYDSDQADGLGECLACARARAALLASGRHR